MGALNSSLKNSHGLIDIFTWSPTWSPLKLNLIQESSWLFIVWGLTILYFNQLRLIWLHDWNLWVYKIKDVSLQKSHCKTLVYVTSASLLVNIATALNGTTE